MTKKFIAFLLSIVFIFASYAKNEESLINIEDNIAPQKNEYVMYIDVFDWGAAVNKIVLNVGKSIKENKIDEDDFSVDIIVNTSNEKSKSGNGVVKGHRIVKDAYLSDSFGNKTKAAQSEYITLELKVSPEESSSNLMLNVPLIDKFDQLYGFRIKNSRLNFTIKQRTAIASPVIRQFKQDVFTCLLSTSNKDHATTEEESLNYSYWLPENKNNKIPLIIWLHGQDGGSESNKYQALMETKAVNLASDSIQKYFEHGAGILVPQCDTSWLITNSKDGFGNNVWAPIKIHETAEKIMRPLAKLFDKIFSTDHEAEAELNEHFASVSYYTEPLALLIQNFIQQNPCIDANRIYIGGSSAGGYMTINMCIQHPELFAAAFTASEAMLDEKIIDSQIKTLRDIPLWFVYNKNDDTIEPEEHSEPTIKRLDAAGAKDLHVTIFDKIIDTETGYQYDNHYAWVYLLNNECTDKGISIFEWLSCQSRSEESKKEYKSKEMIFI